MRVKLSYTVKTEDVLKEAAKIKRDDGRIPWLSAINRYTAHGSK